MQIIIDTVNDSPIEMTLGAELIVQLIRLRVGATDLKDVKMPDVPTIRTHDSEPTFGSDGDDMLPVSALFGKAPLPPEAIEINLPESFTAAPPASPVAGNDAATTTAPKTVDKNGLPWDERIHASTKAVNADGTWRYKRGVDKDLVKQVEAELRGVPAGTLQTGAPIDPTTIVPPPPSNVVPLVPAPPAPSPTAPTAVPLPPSAPAAISGIAGNYDPTPLQTGATYKELNTRKMAPALNSKKVQASQLMEICRTLNPPIPSLQSLIPASPRIPEFASALDALMAAP